MSVGRICVRQVDIAKPHETAQDAAKRMLDRKVGTLVVVNEEREPVGILTDRDLSNRVIAEGRDAADTHVDEVMTPGPRCVVGETSIEEALRIMRSGEYRRLPVVSGRKLIGIVSLDDILDAMLEQFVSVRGLLQEESPRSLATV